MTSRNTELNDVLRFVEIYNSINTQKKITQLEALKIYLKSIERKTV
jgi:hypothetical protein